MSEDWQGQQFRQSAIAKINDFLQSTGQENTNASAMENHIFKKSKTKDEYMSLLGKLYLRLKDMSKRLIFEKSHQVPPSNEEISQQNMIQDPLNALQNLASQGSRNPPIMSIPGGPNGPQMSGPGGPVVATNLLQSLSQQRPDQQQMQQMQGIRPQMPMGAGMPGPGGPGGLQLINQMSGPGSMQMNVMAGSVGGAPQNQMISSNQQMSGAVNGPIGQALSGQLNQMGVPGPGGPMNSNSSGPNQMQLGAAGQMQGGSMTVNAMNVPQLQGQMPQQLQQMNMQHSQLNQIMSARMNQAVTSGNISVGGPNNVATAGMQGMPNNVSQGQPSGSLGPAGPLHSGNVGAGSQGQNQTMPTNPGQGGNLNQMLNMPPGMQKNPNIALGNQMFGVNRVVGQQQFLSQSPSPNTVPSPLNGLSVQQQQLQQALIMPQQQQQQQGGPQTPQSLSNAQMIPSPALVPTSSPQMSNLIPNPNQRQVLQSPNAPLNTPGQVANNSPFNPREEQLYREKYKQLTKYAEPLRRMVAKFGNDGNHVEGHSKMRKLLEILQNPTQRVPLETLLKCEKVLEKLEIVHSAQQFNKSTNPLLDALTIVLQNPAANHVLRRTFRAGLDLMFGTNIYAAAGAGSYDGPPSKRARVIDSGPNEMSNNSNELEIPHLMQGELARLDSKFKITLDSTVQNNSKSIKLVCCLDDKKLPSVPPITIIVPEDYPFSSPSCTLVQHDYAATSFLKTVQNALMARISKLPKLYSVSHILDTWEMSVRQACSPNAAKPILDFTSTLYQIEI